MSHLINIFVEPAKVFAELKEKPSFLLPILVIAVVGGLAAMLYFFNVDPEWFTNHQLQAAGSEMSAAELEQAKQFMPGARTMAYITGPSAVIVTFIVFALYALYYMLAGKISGNATSFKHGLALGAWSSMPMVLGSVLAIVGVYTSSPQSTLESMQMLNIDPLFVQLETGHPWATLARSFSLLNFWVWFLAALGWKTWYRTGWGQALFVVLLPSVVIYGAMALVAAF
ncbi:MAG TPA: YIP1 family protein [Arenimonas sp.]|uniref:YIP1 family protein n=1 Tax=Arenimonas sp. TaxID=1872635 RepID=UPI002D807296|nr:YIP1 family protein [Arenimonas sp.]HEU0152393.1 YIP1 family protein [Arenimonas sp.]